MVVSQDSGNWLSEVTWNEDGLLPAIAQDHVSGRVLMMAWMNPEALKMSVSSGFAVYWSRSRQALWKKGEQSGNRQRLVEISLDCDGDTLLLKVEQLGDIACHTGRQSCFYRRLDDRGEWQIVDAVLRSPEQMYGNDKNDQSK
ncbi:MAG: phosphoribosyl-AMP cyclohydrolase [Immundisolibacteraceae bacterium]|nr:phosphoribosyl-AMP cyclohydrolase [Immundisolibacteraceae bacterium]